MGQELETCRVFVVDDEAIIATTLAVILRNEGFETHSFTSPRDALKAARDDAPDLLVADVMMPEMSGIELAIQFQRSFSRCKILLFSGQAATADLLAKAQSEGYPFALLLPPLQIGRTRLNST